MKKVNSIGKKVMSVGLAASLLMVPVGTNTNMCSAIYVVEEKSADNDW